MPDRLARACPQLEDKLRQLRHEADFMATAMAEEKEMWQRQRRVLQDQLAHLREANEAAARDVAAAEVRRVCVARGAWCGGVALTWGAQRKCETRTRLTRRAHCALYAYVCPVPRGGSQLPHVCVSRGAFA